jgi:hypothetical protein
MERRRNPAWGPWLAASCAFFVQHLLVTFAAIDHRKRRAATSRAQLLA